MATTTNYSWSTPDDTALVKDGAAAIRSLGTAIDTTVFTNAGAAVAKATVDAKGDLIAGTADNTIARLAVGANGTTLVADSSEATGLKWATPAAGGGITQLATGNLSGSAIVTISNISQSHKNLYLFLVGAQAVSGGVPSIRFNADDAARYSGNNLNNTNNAYSNSTLIKLGNDNIGGSGNADFVSLYINNYTLTIHKTLFTQTASAETGQAENYFGWANYNQTTAVTSIDILNSTAASFTGGTFTLFGVS